MLNGAYPIWDNFLSPRIVYISEWHLRRTTTTPFLLLMPNIPQNYFNTMALFCIILGPSTKTKSKIDVSKFHGILWFPASYFILHCDIIVTGKYWKGIKKWPNFYGWNCMWQENIYCDNHINVFLIVEYGGITVIPLINAPWAEIWL